MKSREDFQHLLFSFMATAVKHLRGGPGFITSTTKTHSGSRYIKCLWGKPVNQSWGEHECSNLNTFKVNVKKNHKLAFSLSLITDCYCMHIYRRCLRRLNIDSVLIIIGCFGLFSVQYTCSSTTLVKLTRMQFVSVFNQFYFPLNWLELLFIVLHHLILFIDVFQPSVSCVYVFFWNI